MKTFATALTAFADEISPDLSEQLATLVRLRYTGLDLRSAFGKNVLQLTNDEVLQVRQMTEKAGLVIQAIGSPVNKVLLDSSLREGELRKLERAIEIAHVCGTDRIRIFSPESDNWAEVRGWMDDQVALAASEGILLLHENDANFFGAKPENARKLFDSFGGVNFRAAFDFANTVLIGYRPLRDWFPWLLPHLDTLHIKDAIEAEHRVVAAGEGNGDLLASFRYLVEAGWSGPLTLEPHLASAGPTGGFSGVQLFEHAAHALSELLTELGAHP